MAHDIVVARRAFRKGIQARWNGEPIVANPYYDWQPIETAPGKEPVLCFAADWDWPFVLRCWDGKWMDDSGDSYQDYHPTHWCRWKQLPPTQDLKDTSDKLADDE
jgi:hypothetical protein